MAREVIDIVIREDGSRVVRRNIEDIGKSAERSTDHVRLLKKALYLLGGALIAESVLRWADAWTIATNQIRIATKSTQEAAAVQDRLFDAAQRSRSAILDTTQLYFRLQRAAKDLGASQNQVIDITEATGKALAIQGVSGQQAAGALLQFGQAMATPRIQAEEFNSLLDGMPVLLQAVANNFEGTGGSLGRFTQMVKTGKVTNTEFFEALKKGLPEIEQQFTQMTPTFAQSFQVLENAITRSVGQMNQSLGVSKLFAQAVDFLSSHVDLLVASLASLGVAVAVAFAPKVISIFAGALNSLFVAIAANPIGAFIVAITTATIMLAQFGDSFTVGIDNITTFNDLVRSVGSYAYEGFSAFTQIVGDAMRSFGATILEGVNDAGDIIAGSTSGWADTYVNFYADVGNGFAGFLKGVARTTDAMLSVVWGSFRMFGAMLYNVPFMLVQGAKASYNKFVEIIESMLNETVVAMNKLSEAVGLPLLNLVKIERAKVVKGFMKQVGQEAAEAFDSGIGQLAGLTENTLDQVFTNAQVIAKKRTADLKHYVNLDTPLGKPLPPLDSSAGKEAKEMEKLTNALRTLLNTIDPVAGAKLELVKAQDTLTKALNKGLITASQYSLYMARLERHYRDVIDPLGAMNRELDREIGFLKLSSRQREIEIDLYRRVEDLRKSGVDLGKAEENALREKLTLQQQVNLAVQAEDALLQQSVLRREDVTRQMVAMRELLSNPTSGFTGTDATSALSQMFPDMFEGTQEMFDLQIAQLQEHYSIVDQMRQQDLISEQTAAQMKAKAAFEETNLRMQNYMSFFGNLASLSKSGNRKIAAIGQAAAVTQATIDGVLAVQKALASAPPPMNYALAAAVGVSAAANVAQIAGLKFAKGGAFTNSVVNTPTPFSFGGGQLGIMGEAGPEAIMPLTRGSDGSLGVRAVGNQGGGVVQYVNFHINIEGGNADVSSSGDAAASTNQLRDMIVATCNDWAIREMRPDGVLNRS